MTKETQNTDESANNTTQIPRSIPDHCMNRLTFSGAFIAAIRNEPSMAPTPADAPRKPRPSAPMRSTFSAKIGVS